MVEKKKLALFDFDQVMTDFLGTVSRLLIKKRESGGKLVTATPQEIWTTVQESRGLTRGLLNILNTVGYSLLRYPDVLWWIHTTFTQLSVEEAQVLGVSWEVEDDVIPVLDQMKDQGWSLGVVSEHFTRRRLFRFLESRGLIERFFLHHHSVSVYHGKNKVRLINQALYDFQMPAERTVYLDDLPKGWRFAQQVGVNPVLIATGPYPYQDLVSITEDESRVIHHLTDFPEIANALLYSTE